jgi:hypothetical protein
MNMTERVQAEVNENSNLAIPNEMTKLLQPSDVVINWSFKVVSSGFTTGG